MKCVQMGLLATVILAFDLVVLGFTNANWYAQLRYLKVMTTEIVEGPYLINNIDLYSNYSGNNILIYPSWYWLAKQFFGKNQIYLIIKNQESCSVLIMNLLHCWNLCFYLYICKQPFSFSAEQWAGLTAAGSGILKSKNFTSLHHHWSNTVHNFRTRDASVSKHSQVQVCLSGYTPNCLILLFFFLFFFFYIEFA